MEPRNVHFNQFGSFRYNFKGKAIKPDSSDKPFDSFDQDNNNNNSNIAEGVSKYDDH